MHCSSFPSRTLRRLTLSFALASALAAQGCSASPDALDEPFTPDLTATTEQAAVADTRIDGDALMRRLVEELGANPSSSVRSALDRAANDVAKLGVEPFPASLCTGKPERLYWNGEFASLPRYGAVGAANLIVLDATTQGSFDVWRLAAVDVRSRAELARAIAVLASAESPALLASGVAALAQNPNVRGGDLRALLAFDLDIEETKRFRDASGALRVPDLRAAPSDAALFARLRQSPMLAFRESAASYAASGAIAVSKANIDRLLADTSYRVRAAAGGAFWRGSDIGPARQAAILASFASDESKKQMRADTLREDYGVREEDAGAWSDLPRGIERRYLEAVGTFVGRALEKAPKDADVSVLITAAASLSDISDIVETAIDAVARSTVMTREAKAEALGKLRRAAARAQWNNANVPIIRLSAAVAEMLFDVPLSQLGNADLIKVVDDAFAWAMRDKGWASLRAQLDSQDAAVRRAAVLTLALSRSATECAGFQIALLRRGDVDATTRDAIVAIAGGDAMHLVLRDARAAGADPRAVLSRARALAGPGKFRAGASLATAYFEAARDPALSGDEIVDAVVHFTTKIDPLSVTGLGPGSPGIETVSGSTFALVGLLEDPRVSEAARATALRTILVGPEGLRAYLLEGTSTNERTRRIVADIVRPHLVQTVATCWRGRMEISNPRPGLILSLLPYVVRQPRHAIDPKAILERRVQAVRAASANLAPVAPGTDVAALFAELPKWKGAHPALDRFQGPKRAAYQRSATDIAASILAAPERTTAQDLTLWSRQLGYARDFRALPEDTLVAVEARLAQSIAPTAAAAQYLFFLRAMRGEGYDALAARFRNTVGFRWDLGDAARPRGEQVALETLLASVGTNFGTLQSVLALSSQSVAGAAVSPVFRQGLLEYGAEGERFWTTRGQWAAGFLPLVRTVDEDLSFVLRADAVRSLLTFPPTFEEQFTIEKSLYGTVASDPRLPPSAAVTLAWRRLAYGKVTDLDGFGTIAIDGTPRLHITVLVDTVLGVLARTDVPDDEKRALGSALRYVLSE